VTSAFPLPRAPTSAGGDIIRDANGRKPPHRFAQENGTPPMPEYVAELCHMPGNELVPFDTKEFSADNHDEAVKQAIEWLSLTDIAIDDSTWLQVIFDGSAFFSKEIGQL
jgi:hypothetical protein